MASGFALPKKLLVHGYILMGDQKMSKSLGNTVDPDFLAQQYGVEPVRYYLLRQMPINQDGQFDIKDLEARIAGDLANNLGNLLNRTVTLAQTNGISIVNAPGVLEKQSVALKERAIEAYRIYWEEMNKFNVHIALAELWKFISEVNAYFHALQPWVLAKKNKELFIEVIHTTCQSLHMSGTLLWPIMPKKMELLLASIGHSVELGHDYDTLLRSNAWNFRFTLTKTDEPLFIRPQQQEILQQQETQGITEQKQKINEPIISIDDFARVSLVVGTIMACEAMPKSEKLYKLHVDLGSYGKRQILSGIAKYFKPEDLIGKQGVFVANLAPRTMMGLESQGMLLTADNGNGGLSLVTVMANVPNGTRLK
jgi:methionyl-tRNA synthetase